MIRVEGPTFKEIDPRIDDLSIVMIHHATKVMKTIIGKMDGGVRVAAAEKPPGSPPQGETNEFPIPPPQPPLSLDSLALIATLWVTITDQYLTPFVSESFIGSAKKILSGIRKKLTGDKKNKIPKDAELEEFVTPYLSEDVLANARNRMVNFSDTLWEVARTQLLDGFMKGESIDQLAERLRKVPQISTPRARMVARTEIISASNAGSLAMIQIAGFTGTKSWLATNDDRTRLTHQNAEIDYGHGKGVPIYDPFYVGGSPLQFPGDPRGLPEEIINCRCTLTYDLDDDVLTATGATMATEWIGVLALEGVPTGDGRMWRPGGFEWMDLPAPLLRQRKTAEGHMGSEIVGDIREITRMPVGHGKNALVARGTFDMDTEEGREAYERVHSGYLKGVSVDVDSITPEDVEYRYSENMDGEQYVSMTVFTSGRIRGATLCAIPAFVEANIQCMPEQNDGQRPESERPERDSLPYPSEPMSVIASAVKTHKTGTTDEAWNAAENVKRLPSPMPVGTAREMYAWIDESKVKDGKITKDGCKFPHHMVSESGKPGVANLKACSAGIAALHGARGGTDIPEKDRKGVYEHLAAHLRDGGRKPPPFGREEGSLTASAYVLTIPDVPEPWWFDKPTDVPIRGALTVTDEGRIYGLLAPAKVAHRSFPERVTVPMRNVDYSLFLGRETITAGGGRVVTGALTMDCGHASMGIHDPSVALDHYDNACSIVATVRIGECEEGVWVAGALVPGVSASQVSRMMACQLSGDWRPHRERKGWREFAGALLVPVPGFAMSRSEASVRLEQGELVASAVPVTFTESDVDCGCRHVDHVDPVGLSEKFAALSAIVAEPLVQRMDNLYQQVYAGVR